MKITKSKPSVLLFLIFSFLLTVEAFAQIRTTNSRPSATTVQELYSQQPSLSIKAISSALVPDQWLNRKQAEDYLLKQVLAKRKGGSENQSLKELQPLSDPLPGCADTSQRRLYWLQGRPAYMHYSIRAKDGGMFAVGATIDIDTMTFQWDVFPFILRFNANGDVLWNRQIRGDVRGEMDLQALYEMADGSLLAAGDIQTKQRVNPADPREYDALIVKISPIGELKWSKTYMSTASVCYNSTSLFIKNFLELPGGDIAVSGTVFNCPSPMVPVVMRLTANGDLVWSRAFGEGSLYFMRSQGLFYSANQLSLIFMEPDGIWKVDMPLTSTGNISYKRVGYDYQNYFNQLNALIGSFNTQVIQLSNGYYRIMSPTVASFSTSLRDTSSIFGVLDLNQNFEPFQYRTLSSTMESGYSGNGIITLQPNGRIDAGLFEYLSGYNGNYYIAHLAPDGMALKHRKLMYKGVGMPNGPILLPEFNGEQNLLQTYYDSTAGEFFIENTRLHFSDTASECLGSDTSIFVWGFDKYKMLPNDYKLPVFDTTILPTIHTVWQDTLIKTDLFNGCQQVNYCDSLSIIPPATLVCRPDQVLSLEAYINKACGAWVQWLPEFPEKMKVIVTGQRKADIQFLGNYDGWLYAEMQGNCAFLRDSVRFTVANLPDPLTLGPDTVICPGNLITIRATAGYSAYQWNTGQSGDSTTISNAGKYWVTASDACGGFVSDTVEVKAYVPGLFSAGNNSRICPGETLTLEATTGYFNYRWLPDSLMQNAATPTPTITPLKTTLYRVQAEERPGCWVSDSVLVVVSDVSPFSLGPDFSICNGESRVINGPVLFASYMWSTGAATRDIEVNQAGTYFLEALSVDGCPRRDTVLLLSLNPLPIVRLDQDSVLCAGETKTYSTGANYRDYLWNNGTTASSFTINLPGQYWVQVTDSNGCKGSDTTSIYFIQELPVAFLPADSSICNYDSWQIKPARNYSSYLWSNGATTPAITVNTAGIYKLVVTDTYGCKGEDDVMVAVEQCMEGLFVPTAFTPNGDGNNDIFKGILFGNIELFDFKLYNRFGELIFTSTNTGAGWNGIFKGKPQPAGSYIWQCRYQLQGQPIKEQKGTFLLIR